MSDPWRMRAPKPRIDWQAIKGQLAIEAVVERLCGPPARGLFRRCPLGTHEDRTPSFTVDPERGRWKCFGCGEGGSAADLVMRLEGVTFPQAVERLAALFGFDGGSGFQAPPRPRPQAPPKAPEKPRDEPSGIPLEDAERVVKEAVERLWGPEGREALAYLRDERFLSDETIRRARLGLVRNLAISKRDGTGLFLTSGVVIPWFDGDRLAKINIRRFGNVRVRYAQAFQDRPAVFAPFGVRPCPVVITEGELDCLLLGQELGDRASVVTLGSASGKPSREARRALLAASRLFVATDGDGGGRKSAKRLREHFPQAERIRPPAPDKDWGEVRAGGFGRIAYHWGRFLPLGSPPRPEDFADASLYELAPDERDRIEAQEEREAIQAEGAGVEGEPQPIEEAEPIEPIGPSLPSGGFEPDEGDEAARLALATGGEPESEIEALDRLMGAAGFLRVDLSELDRFAEFDPPAVDRPETTKAPAASRARPRRSTGAGRPALLWRDVEVDGREKRR